MPAASLPLRRLAPLLIAAAVVYAYWNATRGPFIFDDHLAIVENPNVRSLTPITKALFAPGDTGAAGRPLVSLSFAVNYAFAQLNPAPYHATNIALHLLAAWAAFGVLRQVLQRVGHAVAEPVALAAVLIWAVHPLHTEAVTYITNRSEVMMALFALLAAYSFLRSVDSPRRQTWLVLSAACNLASVACKEVGAMVLPLLYLLDVLVVSRTWSGPIRLRPWYYASLLLGWIALPLLLSTVTMLAKTGGEASLTPWQYLLMQSQIIVMYLKLCLWPHPLVITYVGWPVPTLLEALPYGLFLLLLLAATVWLVIRKHPAGLIGACLFLILAPSSSLLPLPAEPAAERRMYLPLLPMAAGAVLGVVYAGRRFRLSTVIGWIAAAVLVLALGQATLWRNEDYGSAVALWADAADKLPENGTIRFELGGVLQDQGNYDGALECYNQAIALSPNDPKPRINRAGIWASRGDVPAAMAEVDLVLQRYPGNLDAQTLRAHLLTLIGRREEAIQILEEVLRRRPHDVRARFALDEARKGL